MKRYAFIAMVVLLAGMFLAGDSFARVRYVTTSGKSTNSGASESTAWSITRACSVAVAGDTVYVKGGLYGNKQLVVINSGTSESKRISFMGYSGRPTFNGAGSTTSKGIQIVGKKYITLKNMNFSRYGYNVWVNTGSHKTILDGIIADSAYVGTGSDGYGIMVQDSDTCIVRNCTAIDNDGDNFFLSRSHYCTIKNCKAITKQTSDNGYLTDYLFVIAWSSHNTIWGCYASDSLASYKGNHGFIIKDNPKAASRGSESHSTANRIAYCSAYKFEECFCLSHGAYSNTIDSCYASNTGKNSNFNHCIVLRDSAHDNTIKNVTGIGKSGCVIIADRAAEGTTIQAQRYNKFYNCTFTSGEVSVCLQNAVGTLFQNCTFANSEYMFRFEKANTSNADSNRSNSLKNCIVYNVTTKIDTEARASYGGWLDNTYDDMASTTATYTDFYGGFTKLSGTGNISSNPFFASSTDFHLKSPYGRWNGSSWVTTDTSYSPCIDAGDSSTSCSLEPENNGNRINMGRYGNTKVASKSKRGYKVVAETPVEFGLLQNVPNPFNPSTTISYTVASEGMVTLKVYSANGQLVGTLVDEVKAPGSYRATWAPKGLASGMYFCKLQAGSFTKTNKMIFMK